MAAEEKNREDALWLEFAQTGQMPESARRLVAEKGIDYVKNLLAQDYNHLTKLIAAEAVMVCEGAVEPYVRQQAEAARWVRNLVFAKSRNYERKQEMASALSSFMEVSLNPLLNKVGGLVKAREMLRQASSSGAGAVEFAGKCLARLVELKTNDPGFATVREFLELTVAVAWEFVRGGDAAGYERAMSLLPDGTTENAFLDGQIAKLLGKRDEFKFAPIRDWTFKAKDLYHGLPTSVESVRASIRELDRHAALVSQIRGLAKIREMMLMWLSLFLVKLKKTASGIGPEIGNCFVRILQADGLEGLPESCWERMILDPPPEKGDGVLPSTAERLVNGLYAIVKDWRPSEHVGGVATIEWLIDRLENVYAKLPDEKWGDFRIGKLLMLVGRMDEARKRVMPTVRRNQTQFWAWDALGRLFPEHRRVCVARAMLCPADEQMKVRVRKEAEDLALPLEDESAMRREAAETGELLLEGMASVKGILEARYKNKEGKDRVRFFLENGADVRPVSPGAVRLPRDVDLGTPVSVFLDETEPSRIIAVRRREGTLWDLLPETEVVYYGKSKKGNAMLAAVDFETTCPAGAFSQLRDAQPGDSAVIHYLARKRDFANEKNVIVYEVKSVALTGDRSDRVFAFEGPLRTPNGMDGPLFVNGIFIPHDLIGRLLGRGIKEGTVLNGMAVRLPPRTTMDRFGNRRQQSRSQAITLDILGGEELERYRMANS